MTSIIRPMSDVQIRPGKQDDLEAMWRILYENDMRGVENPPEFRPPLTLRHHLATGLIFAAESEGRVVGFCAGIVRQNLLYVTFAYIDPSFRGQSVGASLLNALLGSVNTPNKQLVSTHNMSAVSLYLRSGFRPIGQLTYLGVESARLTELARSSVELEEAKVGDPDLIDWDARLSGRRRPEDFAHWADVENARFFWFTHAGERVGYATARINSQAVFGNDQISFGPVGIVEGREVEAISSLVRWGANEQPRLELISFFGSPALPCLLDSGFRIEYLCSFMGCGATTANRSGYFPSDWEF